jgi:syntaxin-binding protein 1
VVDEHSKALLESVYQLFDILHMNITGELSKLQLLSNRMLELTRPRPLLDGTGMEMLMSPRPPQQSLDVVYLLTPTTQNVNRILADFTDGRRSYKQVHLYFIDGKSRKDAGTTILQYERTLMFGDGMCSLGIHDKLAERLTSGLPDNILQSFVELYCNFRGKLPGTLRRRTLFAKHLDVA